MRIARATAVHIPALVALMTASPLLRRYGVTPRGARTGLFDARRRRDIVLVAVAQGQVLGFAWVMPTRALDRAAYLRLLLVAEGRQSQGVGASLLAAAERTARTTGCRHMLLLVTSSNRGARAFYAREGYRYVGSLPDFARAGITEAMYVKSWRPVRRRPTAMARPVVRRRRAPRTRRRRPTRRTR
jgi:GNAT superfamily N-acetyltransferase